MGFQMQEAQWLIQFFRNLPGNRRREVTEREYERSWNEQRAQAAAMPEVPVQLAWTYDDPNNPQGY